MSLSAQDNPDGQAPMPFAAADVYAQTVMAWGRELLAQAAAGQAMRVTLDIPYGSHRLHRYNVFAPAAAQCAARGAPVVVFWHGGGWTNGYRDYNSFMAEHLVAMGCVLVSPSYRLVSQARLPAAFNDSVQMLAHVAAHIGAQGGDGQRLYLAGHSAGGHLAALVALRTAARTAAGVPQAAVRACLPISGIMDLHHPQPAPGSLEARVYTDVLADPDHDAVMSPMSWTAGNQVPFVLTVGQQDSERVRRSNARLHALLGLQHAPVSLAVQAGHDHFQTHTALRLGAAPWYGELARVLAQTGS